MSAVSGGTEFVVVMFLPSFVADRPTARVSCLVQFVQYGRKPGLF